MIYLPIPYWRYGKAEPQAFAGINNSQVGCVSQMQIDMNPKKQYIDIWLNRDEEKPNIKDIKQIFPTYSITVFRPGTGDLAALTAELLRTNAAKMADVPCQKDCQTP